MRIFSCSISKTNRLLVIFLLAFATVLPCFVQAEEKTALKTVEATGTSRIDNENIASARNNAISNSLAFAVESAASDLLSLDSLVQNFQTLNKILYSHTDQFIQGYKVLAESMFENRYRVMVQATVSVDMVEEQLSKFGILTCEKRMPSILFLIVEQNLEEISLLYWWGENMAFFKTVSEKAMAKAMMEKDFSVIDHSDMAQNLSVEIVNDRPYLNDNDAVMLGAGVKADVVIVGKSIAQKTLNTLGTYTRSFKATVSARALRTDTGEEIASTVQTAVTVNSDEIAGGMEALSNAGILAGNKMALQVASVWQKKIKESAKLSIIVEGTSNLANFVMFRKALNNMSGASNIQIVEIETDKATIIIDFQGHAKTFADALMLNTFESFRINIYEVWQNRLMIELIPA